MSLRTTPLVRRLAALALAVTCIASCTSDTTVAPGVLGTIRVTPSATLAPGGTQQMVAVGVDAEGHELPIAPLWTVVNGGGTVTLLGVFTAGATAGTFTNTVVATAGGISGAATITVTAGELASITVSPTPATLSPLATQRFTATGLDANGNPVAITPSWSVTAGGGAIDGAGLFTAGAAVGTFGNTVRANVGTIGGTATVVVVSGPVTSLAIQPVATTLAANGTQRFVAVGSDAFGNTQPVVAVWTVVAGGGTIASDGLFVAGRASGTFTNTVHATSGALSAAATVTVTSGTLAGIAIAPGAATVGVRGTQRFVTTGVDANGNAVAESPVWSVIAGGGTIDATGLFTAGTVAGAFPGTVQATSGAFTATAGVTVTGGSLATMLIAPAAATLAIDATQSFVASGSDAFGNAVAVVPSWGVVAGGGTIDASGLFRAGSVAGTFTGTVKAVSGAVTATATVIVAVDAVATIAVTPNPGSVGARGTVRFAAIARDDRGNTVPLVPTWSVVAGGGTIDQTGLFTAGSATGAFANTVQATGAGVSGRATVMVTAGAVTSIVVAPGTVTLMSGASQQLTAAGADAAGNLVPVAPDWAIVSGGGSISASGVVTAGAVPGTYPNTVRATSGTLTGFATLVVLPLPGVTTAFEDFVAGPIDRQHDWKSLGGIGAPSPLSPSDTHCAVYDHQIADNTAAGATYRYAALGNRSLRISNAVTSGCYGDQTFSNRTANVAGERNASSISTNGLVSYALPGAVLQNHFEAEWTVMSAVPGAEQPGLEVVVSPARGDDSRMSWLQMADLPDGIAIVFAERGPVASPGDFRLTTVVRGLPRNAPHTIKLAMDFVEGPDNDVVQVWVDGVLRHTGTSWENYYRYDVAGSLVFAGASPVVNRLMFRTGSDLKRGIPGTAAPATRGHGFIFDNLRQATGVTTAASAARRP